MSGAVPRYERIALNCCEEKAARPGQPEINAASIRKVACQWPPHSYHPAAISIWAVAQASARAPDFGQDCRLFRQTLPCDGPMHPLAAAFPLKFGVNCLGFRRVERGRARQLPRRASLPAVAGLEPDARSVCYHIVIIEERAILLPEEAMNAADVGTAHRPGVEM